MMYVRKNLDFGPSQHKMGSIGIGRQNRYGTDVKLLMERAFCPVMGLVIHTRVTVTTMKVIIACRLGKDAIVHSQKEPRANLPALRTSLVSAFLCGRSICEKGQRSELM